MRALETGVLQPSLTYTMVYTNDWYFPHLRQHSCHHSTCDKRSSHPRPLEIESDSAQNLKQIGNTEESTMTTSNRTASKAHHIYVPLHFSYLCVSNAVNVRYCNLCFFKCFIQDIQNMFLKLRKESSKVLEITCGNSTDHTAIHLTVILEEVEMQDNTTLLASVAEHFNKAEVDNPQHIPSSFNSYSTL